MRSARADKYREEAARLRREAEDMKHSENRQQLLDIAAQYVVECFRHAGGQTPVKPRAPWMTSNLNLY